MFESVNSSGTSAVSGRASVIRSYACCPWWGGVFAQVEAGQCVVQEKKKRKIATIPSVDQPVPVRATFSWITSLGVGSSRAAPAALLLSSLLQVGLLSNSPRGLQLSKPRQPRAARNVSSERRDSAATMPLNSHSVCICSTDMFFQSPEIAELNVKTTPFP